MALQHHSTSFLFWLLLLCLGTDAEANCVHSDANLVKGLNTLCASLGGSSSNCPAGNVTAEEDWLYKLACSTHSNKRHTDIRTHFRIYIMVSMYTGQIKLFI